MKKLLLFVLAAMAFVACTQNDVEELTANRADAPETLTVGFEGDDTRIELNEVCKTVWSAGDEASVFYRSNANQRWAFQGETGDRIGTLKRVANAEATAQMTKVVVVYPYNTNYWLNYANGNIEATLPAVQSYKEGSYGAEGNIMVAQSEFTQFSLKSVCGWLRVELTGKRHVVNSITLRGNAGEQVAGLIYVDTATAEATLASEMGEASDEEQVGGVGGGLEFDDTIFTEVTLDCGDGVELGAEATVFYIALLPQTFEKGMTVEINYANGNSQTLVCENSITIIRNHISPIESEANVEVEIPTNQLCYTATALVEPNDTSAFNVAIVSNEWDEATGEGVITFDGELTTIGDYAFGWCDSLTSVTIPDSVTTIGDGVFTSCSSLTEFKGKFAADGGRCLIKDNAIIAYAEASGTTYTIPDSVTTIGDYAFYRCTSLTSVTIPDSVTTIGNWAFAFCKSLTSVTIGDSVTTIGDSAFDWCDSLTSVTIPDSVTTIGEEAFSYCDSLTSVTIGDSVTTIGNYAFECCTSLTSVTIGDSVTTIGSHAFAGCLRLTSVTIPDSVTTIGEWAFYDCYNLTSVTIGDSVTTIGVSAFLGCNSLTSVTIGDSVTTIGDAAFTSCDSLAEFKGKFAADGGRCLVKDNTLIAYANASGTTYTIPDSVTTIGYRAFLGCTSLTSVTIPDSVTTIGSEAFGDCINLAEFKGKFAEDGGRCLIIDGVLNAFALGCGVTEYTIPDSVTTIGNYAFRYCSSLTSVTIGDSVTTIGNDAFWSCESLTSVTIPDSVMTIGDWAFYDCSSLTSVTIPDSVTTIGEEAFYYCTSLTSVTIGDSVTTIGDWAFNNCTSLTSVYCKATTPPTLGRSIFYNNPSGRKIYLPAESVEEYKAATNWSEYAADILAYDFETGEVVDTTPANEL